MQEIYKKNQVNFMFVYRYLMQMQWAFKEMVTMNCLRSMFSCAAHRQVQQQQQLPRGPTQ